MKKLLALAMMPFSAALANPMSSVAQEKFRASAGIELASSYVWRGQDLGNASIQPSLTTGLTEVQATSTTATAIPCTLSKRMQAMISDSLP